MTVPLLAKHALREPVAFGAGGQRTAEQLLRDAARIAARLPEPRPGSHVLLAIRSDRYAFAAGLLGIWARGHTAALPPDAGRDWVLRLAQCEGTVAVLHDIETDGPIRVDRILAEVGPSEPARLALPELLVTQYSGDPAGTLHAWPKRRAQLLGEATAWAEALALPERSCVLSSIPPSQQYGLSCGVLWPLLTGGAFAREIRLDAVVDALRARAAVVLVSVPVHLRHFAREAPDALARVACVVSSRAALSRALPARELFGTSATGALGWRSDSGGFRPLPGVRVSTSESGELVVDSPYLDPSQARPFAIGDFGRVDERGEFWPRGRAAEWYGTSTLPELEAELGQIEGVADLALLILADQQLVAAVVVSPGADESAARARLVAAAAQPRLARIAFFPKLPRTSTGRPRRERMLEQLGCDSQGKPLRFELDWQSETGDADGHGRVFRVHVPGNYGHFAGHFAGYPILPGAAQLSELVLPCVRRARPDLGRLEQMSRIKFSGRIQPDDALDVALRWRGDEPVLEFTLQRVGTLCATGRLTFVAGVAV